MSRYYTVFVAFQIGIRNAEDDAVVPAQADSVKYSYNIEKLGNFELVQFRALCNTVLLWAKCR